MKKLKEITLLVIIFFFVAFGVKDFALNRIITFSGSRAIGVKVNIGKLSWEIFKNKIIIRELRIYNPKNFPDEIMLDIALMDIGYKLTELLNGRPRLSSIAMDVRKTVLIKNKDRKLNINELKLTKDADEGNTAVPVFPVQIGVLKLNMGPVIFKDYSKNGKPVVKTFDVGLKTKEFRNITSARKLVAVVLFDAVRRTSIKGAKIYALAALLGPTAIPAGITGVLIGKDHADGEFNVQFDRAYAAALGVLRDIGEVIEENIEEGLVKAKVSERSVSVRVNKISESSVKITASARMFKMPRPNFAGGILYQISQNINGEHTYK